MQQWNFSENNLPPGTDGLVQGADDLGSSIAAPFLRRIFVVGLQTAIVGALADSAAQKDARRKPAQG